MLATIAINGAKRSSPDLPAGRRWQCAVEARRGDKVCTAFVGVSQRALSDFQDPMIVLPTEQPEWVCWGSVKRTVSLYFANQAAAEMVGPDGTAADALVVAAQIEDEYEAGMLPWSYRGTTLLESGLSQVVLGPGETRQL